jgi:ABC-type polysaccharide/polyol phosphate export permease
MIGLAVGLAVAIVVFVISGGHVLFLPLLFLPLGIFTFGGRRRQ